MRDACVLLEEVEAIGRRPQEPPRELDALGVCLTHRLEHPADLGELVADLVEALPDAALEITALVLDGDDPPGEPDGGARLVKEAAEARHCGVMLPAAGRRDLGERHR